MAEQYFTRKHAAAFLTRIGCPVTYQQLLWWASKGNAGRGPPFIRIGERMIRYSETDLTAWARTNVKRVE